VLYVIACAATPAANIGLRVAAAQQQSWVTCVIARPSAVRLLDPAGHAQPTVWQIIAAVIYRAWRLHVGGDLLLVPGAR
jgi:hypothetical protein